MQSKLWGSWCTMPFIVLTLSGKYLVGLPPKTIKYKWIYKVWMVFGMTLLYSISKLIILSSLIKDNQDKYCIIFSLKLWVGLIFWLSFKLSCAELTEEFSVIKAIDYTNSYKVRIIIMSKTISTLLESKTVGPLLLTDAVISIKGYVTSHGFRLNNYYFVAICTYCFYETEFLC